jgi:putative endonuclease
VPAPLQARGFDAEARALELLRRHGLRPVDRNVRFKAGEIDLIMRDGVEWVFIEVRSRGQARFGGAAASVGWRKQQRVARAAQLYLLRRFGQSAWPACRFDVVAFEADEPCWIRAAFTPG